MSGSANLNASLLWQMGPAAPTPEQTVLFTLLRGIDRDRALASAAVAAGISYRNAWGLLRRWEAHFGAPLVLMQRGRGSALSPFGEELLRAADQANAHLAPALAVAAELMREALAKATASGAATLTIAASHDLALTTLADTMRASGFELRLNWRGSYDALLDMTQGRADVAGFHCARGPLARGMWRQFKPLLKERSHALIPIFRRTQGIMTAAGNPLGIRDLEDLAARHLSIINRQPGSGTRLLLDELLSQAAIQPAQLAGYGSAEFTHAAVAATIAAGQADAGIGIEAAARAFGLDFVPVVQEEYVLAVRRQRLASPGVAGLLDRLNDQSAQRIIAALPGYKPSTAKALTPGEFEALLLGVA